ncbi:MAG: hypothetical protein R3D85_01750 [Paracoccaceae bacterium]
MSAAAPLRPPSRVMRLSRLGSLHQCRLSFMRQLTRRMGSEGWSFSRPVWQIDTGGVGHAVYTARAPGHAYSLVAFAHDLPDDLRSDRVIAEAWDATFALFDGVPSPDDIARLAANVPLQEAGRVSERELTLSRANRSVRLWDHVVGALAQGRQPDPDRIAATGYLMRTTAVYGSGKFGAADRATYAHRREMEAPFQAEMLTVWLIRSFVRDLANHMARARGGASAVPLAPATARALGIGNSTGLGLAPFILNHPVLFHNWIAARETAIARVRALPTASAAEAAQFRALLAQSAAMVAHWHSDHPLQIAKLTALRHDLAALTAWCETDDLTDNAPFDRLIRWSEDALSEEGQELAASLILEPFGPLVDDLGPAMADAGDDPQIDGSMTTATAAALIARCYDWALALDWSDPAQTARAWYVSEEKLEPRLGERYEDPIEPYEQPLAPARDAALAHAALGTCPPETPLAQFLLHHPEHRHTLRRAQIAARHRYAEIQGNTIAADMLPIDMLRAKLAFFGATRFDPRSDRWVRITMFQNAPYPDELTPDNADLWPFPEAAP